MNVKELPKGVKNTKFGTLSREIEESVSDAASGKKGATTRAIKYAKLREVLLNSRWQGHKKRA
ncbi:hypothetical protein [Tabrizicola sp. BL-A-41-H6]|uniref:hypothetical protein n=1 Tax=Tabrizicola sp. BL-A-41-H6 TaxID=3421107 RepID=UPI003D672749